MTTMPSILQADWDALTAAYGRVSGELLVWQRVSAEREAEVQGLREQLAALDELPDQEGGA